MSQRKIKIVQYGLGPIGMETAKEVLRRENLQLVGAIDIAPEKNGRDLGELLGVKGPLGIRVSHDAGSVLLKNKPDVVLHTTQSLLKVVYPQLREIIQSGANVISSTEELLYPQLKNPRIATDLNELAKEHKVTVLGTGVNPGFVMDTLALVLTGVCTEVKRIRVTRIVDVSTRRLPLQRKVGAGLTQEEFERRIKEGRLGHVGLVESLALIAYGLGWTLEDIRESIQPVIAERDLETEYFKISKAHVAGIKHIARGLKERQEAIILDLRMYVGAEGPRDSICIEGTPGIEMTIRKGIMGDIATVASLVNAIPRVLEAEAGLKTMADLPIPRAFEL